MIWILRFGLLENNSFNKINTKLNLTLYKRFLLELSTLISVPTICTAARESLNSGGGLGQAMLNPICSAAETSWNIIMCVVALAIVIN